MGGSSYIGVLYLGGCYSTLIGCHLLLIADFCSIKRQGDHVVFGCYFSIVYCKLLGSKEHCKG